MEVSNGNRIEMILDLTISPGSSRHEERPALVGFWQMGPGDIHNALEDLSPREPKAERVKDNCKQGIKDYLLIANSLIYLD